MATHHGGAWKVAFADFVTALMALFIVLWLLSSSEETKAAVAAYFNNPSIFPGEGRGFLSAEGAIALQERLAQIEAKRELQGGGDEESSGTESEQREMEEEFFMRSAKAIQSAIDQDETLSEFDGQVSIELSNEGLRIQIHDEEHTPLFLTGSEEATDKTKKLLGSISQVLADLPNEVIVEGHTDARPFAGGTTTNWELSARRANAARRVLEEGGVDPTRIARVVGYADRNLLDKERPFSTRNRRISIVVRYQD